jgi:hypothetical protein
VLEIQIYRTRSVLKFEIGTLKKFLSIKRLIVTPAVYPYFETAAAPKVAFLRPNL